MGGGGRDKRQEGREEGEEWSRRRKEDKDMDKVAG